MFEIPKFHGSLIGDRNSSDVKIRELWKPGNMAADAVVRATGGQQREILQLAKTRQVRQTNVSDAGALLQLNCSESRKVCKMDQPIVINVTEIQVHRMKLREFG